MAIEVIRRGHLPENDQFEAECCKCKSQLRFLRSDARHTSDQRDGDFVTVTCPVCQGPVHAQSGSGKPAMPPPSRK